MKIEISTKEEAAKALFTLYRYQTPQEQYAQTTVEDNGVGFNATDAGFASSVAKWMVDGKPLTDGQFKVLQRILPKYKRQLEENDWTSTALPAGVVLGHSTRPDKPVIQGKGRLQIGKDGRLEFYPNVYPSVQIKSLGFAWDKPVWVFKHYSVGLVNQVVRMFEQVEITPELQGTLVQMATKQDLPDSIKNHDKLFPFQKEGIQFLLGSHRSMLALAPGLGKTACAIHAAGCMKEAKHVLIISPLSLIYNWQKEITMWVHQPADIWHGPPSSWLVHSKDYRWVVVNYDTAVSHKDTLLKLKWDVLIVDESVLVKNRKAQRSKAIKELAGAIPIVWELSGAPTTRFYDDLWSQLNILDKDRFRSYWRFAQTYTVVVDNGWGLGIVANRSEAAKQLQDDLSDIYFCRTQDEVLDLPDWIIENIPVPLEGRQLEMYNEMEQEFLTSLPDGDVVLAPNVLSQIVRLLQIASNPLLIEGDDLGAKWIAVEDLLQFERLPVIIWTNFVKTANELYHKLEKKFRVACLTGESGAELRQQIVTDFQGGNLDILIAHPGVGKFGLTLTAARTAIYLERSFNGDDYYQSLHRIRRIGTKHSPHVIHLLAEGENGAPTIDHVVDKILMYRKEQNFKLTTSDITNILKGDSNDGSQ